MKRLVIASLSTVIFGLLCSNAMAYQSGTIYVSKTGEWMCIDKWGNEIPPSSSGGWTVVNPPRKVGGDCNNRRAVLLGTDMKQSTSIDGAVMQDGPVVSNPKVLVQPAQK